jgi:hypothetical protein
MELWAGPRIHALAKTEFAVLGQNTPLFGGLTSAHSAPIIELMFYWLRILEKIV